MRALVGVIMGSKSDWSTLSHTAQMLDQLGIAYEVKVSRPIAPLIYSFSTLKKLRRAVCR